ncbi:MAG TPA: hypothetical protein VGB50_10440 [Flavobacterium sp.]|jgi:hypothetical protein
MEANGEFSVIKNTDTKPGLSIVPEWDREMRDRQKKENISVCTDCGSEVKPNKKCRCGNESSEPAVI